MGGVSIDFARALRGTVDILYPCWVLPGLENVSCLSGPVRPLRLVVCVISGLLSARLSPEGSRLLSYLCICIARYRTCVHSRYVRYVYDTSLRAQALTL